MKVPVSAYVGSSKKLKDLKELKGLQKGVSSAPVLGGRVPPRCFSWSLVGGPPGEAFISARKFGPSGSSIPQHRRTPEIVL